jgi:hypothetical protein
MRPRGVGLSAERRTLTPHFHTTCTTVGTRHVASERPPTQRQCDNPWQRCAATTCRGPTNEQITYPPLACGSRGVDLSAERRTLKPHFHTTCTTAGTRHVASERPPTQRQCDNPWQRCAATTCRGPTNEQITHPPLACAPRGVGLSAERRTLTPHFHTTCTTVGTRHVASEPSLTQHQRD